MRRSKPEPDLAAAASDSARIEELESRLAHQDHALLELSNELYRQQRQVADLERLVRELRDRIEPLERAQSAGSGQAEIPPHY